MYGVLSWLCQIRLGFNNSLFSENKSSSHFRTRHFFGTLHLTHISYATNSDRIVFGRHLIHLGSLIAYPFRMCRAFCGTTRMSAGLVGPSSWVWLYILLVGTYRSDLLRRQTEQGLHSTDSLYISGLRGPGTAVATRWRILISP